MCETHRTDNGDNEIKEVRKLRGYQPNSNGNYGYQPIKSSSTPEPPASGSKIPLPSNKSEKMDKKK